MVAGGRPIRPERNGPPPAVAKIPMNISEPFIRRPVMTTLLMVGVVLFGVARVLAAAGERPAERRLPDDPGDARPCPARARRRWPSSVATPLEKQFSTIAGLDVDDLDQRARVRPPSRCSSTSTATSTRPPRTCSRRSRRRCAGCRRTCPSRRRSEGEPGRLADPVLALHVRHAAAVRGQRVRRDAARAAASRWSTGVAAGAWCSARRSTRSASRSTRRGSPPAASASTRSRSAIAQRQRQPADRHARGRAPRVHDRRPRPARQRAADSARDRRLPQRRAGAARRPRRGRATASRTTSARPGSTASAAIVLAIQRQPGANTVDVADAFASALPGVRSRSCPPSVELDVLYDRVESIRDSIERRAVHAAAGARAGRAGDLPVPAQRPRRRSSRASRCRCRSSARSG